MILEKPKQTGITIDLTGPQGNAFYLLGTASNLAKQLGMNSEEICSEMRRCHTLCQCQKRPGSCNR
jgi:hypothetical protein